MAGEVYDISIESRIIFLGLLIGILAGCLLFLFKVAIEKAIQNSNLKKIRALKKRIRKTRNLINRNNRDHSADKAKYEEEELQAVAGLTVVSKCFVENHYDLFWESIDFVQARIFSVNESLEQMFARKKRFEKLRKQYEQLCELTGTAKDPLMMVSYHITEKVHTELIDRKSRLEKALSKARTAGESNIDFLTALRLRQQLQQNEQQHQERLEQDKKHHYQRLMQAHMQHKERMEGIEEMTDAQERTLEFMEELEEEREKRRRRK